nr:hypothetical protein [Amylibacter sp.]
MRIFTKRFSLAVLLSATPFIANAQMKFTTAEQIKPILTATKSSWIAVREYDGSDILYFTQLLSWRCGLSRLSYSVNDENTLNDWDLGHCNEELPNPNVFAEDQKIFATFPLGSIQTVTVHITYDDESKDQMRFERKAVFTP